MSKLEHFREHFSTIVEQTVFGYVLTDSMSTRSMTHRFSFHEIASICPKNQWKKFLSFSSRPVDVYFSDLLFLYHIILDFYTHFLSSTFSHWSSMYASKPHFFVLKIANLSHRSHSFPHSAASTFSSPRIQNHTTTALLCGMLQLS